VTLAVNKEFVSSLDGPTGRIKVAHTPRVAYAMQLRQGYINGKRCFVNIVI